MKKEASINNQNLCFYKLILTLVLNFKLIIEFILDILLNVL